MHFDQQALAVPNFTCFTTEGAADAGSFAINVKRPHTIVLKPDVVIWAALAGFTTLLADRTTASS